MLLIDNMDCNEVINPIRSYLLPYYECFVGNPTLDHISDKDIQFALTFY